MTNILNSGVLVVYFNVIRVFVCILEVSGYSYRKLTVKEISVSTVY